MKAATPLVEAACVRLDLPPGARAAAVRATAELLCGDVRLGDWEAFWSAMGERQVIDLDGCQQGVVLAHGRSAEVRTLALAAGRRGGGEDPLLVFVFAIPLTMAEEYLRKVGALARVCRDAPRLAALARAASTEEFARLLEDWLA